jgi:hypothetical protein
MYSFVFTNNPIKVFDSIYHNNNESFHESTNNTIRNNYTNNLDTGYDGEARTKNMNSTFAARLKEAVDVVTSSDNISMSTESNDDKKLSSDIGNVTLAISKVRKFLHLLTMTIDMLCTHEYGTIFLFQLFLGITSKSSSLSNSSVKHYFEEDEEINQFYFYEVC